MYVNSLSNHPPGVLRNIPMGINKRLCEIYSSKEVFLQAIPPYQKELDDCGYQHRLVWMEEGMGQSGKKSKTKLKTKGLVQPTIQPDCSDKCGERVFVSY